MGKTYCIWVLSDKEVPACMAMASLIRPKTLWLLLNPEIPVCGKQCIRTEMFDLVRQGRAGTVFRAYAEKYNTVKGKNFRDGINELLPIPQSEIDLSQGKLTQNTGY